MGYFSQLSDTPIWTLTTGYESVPSITGIQERSIKEIQMQSSHFVQSYKSWQSKEPIAVKRGKNECAQATPGFDFPSDRLRVLRDLFSQSERRMHFPQKQVSVAPKDVYRPSIFFFPHPYFLALAVNKSLVVYILSRALDGLWRENRGSVNRLHQSQTLSSSLLRYTTTLLRKIETTMK